MTDSAGGWRAGKGEKEEEEKTMETAHEPREGKGDTTTTIVASGRSHDRLSPFVLATTRTPPPPALTAASDNVHRREASPQ